MHDNSCVVDVRYARVARIEIVLSGSRLAQPHLIHVIPEVQPAPSSLSFDSRERPNHFDDSVARDLSTIRTQACQDPVCKFQVT